MLEEPGRQGPVSRLQWAWRMAWRDSRGQRGVLLLFVFCIVFGIAGMVAIASLRANLEATVATEAGALLGADLRLQTRQPFTPELEDWVRALGGAQSREVQFRSMARFPSAGQTRFVQVRALEPGFPFYGALETDPVDADMHRPGDHPAALVEAGLLRQYGMVPGDVMELGEGRFTIIAGLERVAGESELGGFFAPRVFIPFSALDQTALLREGSVAVHRRYLAFEDGLTEERREAVETAEQGLLIDAGARVTTVEDRQERLARVMGNLFSFLSLVGFIALLLGGIGVGGAVQVYLQPKLASVATLRCLGAPAGSAFAIYLFQVTVTGFVGAGLGAGAGVAAQVLLRLLLQPFLPFDLHLSPAPGAIALGVVFGWLTATLFALRPLLGIRKISPLRALRVNFEPEGRSRDAARASITALLVVLGIAYSIWQAPEWWQGLGFAAGLAAAFGILLVTALAARAALRRLRSPKWPYAVRLALSNLYRPNNRTIFLVTTLGLGAFLISTLHLARLSLLAQVDATSAEDAPNVILVDVQADQLEAIKATLAEAQVPVDEVLPVITMRPRSIKGRTLHEWREMPDSPLSNWVYSWEFRASYRAHLLPNATVTAGTFIGHWTGGEPVPISLSDNLLDDIPVAVGDEIEWDVQGLPVRTYVSSIRQINWELGRQNFSVLWPTGVLEAAPTTYGIAGRVGDREAILALQRTMGERFPNVSLLDLTLIIETLDTVLRRVSFVVQFMAGFTVFTGLVVLFAAMVTSRYQRVRESVFLRTMGADSRFIRTLLTCEYALLGALAASVGVSLSVGATAMVARWIFDSPLVFAPGALAALFSTVVALTILTGWLNSRGIVGAPPLRILREER